MLRPSRVEFRPLPLSAGARLGPYEIVSPLGSGGMGDVYRARDLQLGRDVALKVLPDAFNEDADRLARFKREAQVLASLNHPHIAAIYAVQDSGTTHSLILELVDGETLASRLRRGALPLDEAIQFAREIAAALQAAHEHGIVHRDLKPANIALTATDQIKVLDFGLAKALDKSGESGGAESPGGAAGVYRPDGTDHPDRPDHPGHPDLSPSPTVTVTEPGMLIGTAAHMSPEQAKGRVADKRSDIWAFGTVFYEMLTGAQAFEGEDVLETLTSVMRDEPDWRRLPAATPSHVRALLERCLKKDRRQRLSDMAVVQFLLDAPPPSGTMTGSEVPLRTPASLAVRVLPWAIAAVLAAALVVALGVRPASRQAAQPAVRTLVAQTGADAPLYAQQPFNTSNLALSPDGGTFVYVGLQSGGRRLYVRKLDQLKAVDLPGIGTPFTPFFSPDGQWIGFNDTSNDLKKVRVTGGPVVTLSKGGVFGGTWTEDDRIIFSLPSPQNGTLMQVSADGGTPTPFGSLTPGATVQRWPQALPGGKGVLYTEHTATVGFDSATIAVAPLSGGTPKVVMRGAFFGRYASSGHLLFVRQGTLFAVPFDLDRLETMGQPVPALDGVAVSPATGGAHFALALDGTLVYLPSEATGGDFPISWLTREGEASVLRATPSRWANPSFSPDGQKLAIDIFDGKQSDIFVYEWARDTLTQLTFDPGDDTWPAWTPDGRRIVFGSDRATPGIPNLYWVNADGTGEVTQLHEGPASELPLSWHPSGKFLTYTQGAAGGQADTMILPLEGDAIRGWSPGKPFVFLNTPATESYAMFSPDGRWIAYTLTEPVGTAGEVYVRPFPGPGGPWRISTQSGVQPEWLPSGHELLYLEPTTNTIKYVSYTVVGDSFRANTPQVWQPTAFTRFGRGRSFGLHPDGKRVALIGAQGAGVEGKVTFVFNFFDELRRLAPVTRR